MNFIFKFIFGILSSDKFVSAIVPVTGSALLHVTVFAAIMGYLGWGEETSPHPEAIAIELVRADATSASKGDKHITDKMGARSQKKQIEKNASLSNQHILASLSNAKVKTPHSLKRKKAKTKTKKNQTMKVASRSNPGSRQQMIGKGRPSKTHGPKFSGKGLSNPRPSYPHAARSKGQQGRVVLKVRVSSSGRPVSVRVSKSSGVKSLDRSAMRAVKRWRFYPARKNGRAVTGIVYTPITFRLVN